MPTVILVDGSACGMNLGATLRLQPLELALRRSLTPRTGFVLLNHRLELVHRFDDRRQRLAVAPEPLMVDTAYSYTAVERS